MKIYIWGTGRIATDYMNTGEVKTEDVRGFIETVKTKKASWGKKCMSRTN